MPRTRIRSDQEQDISFVSEEELNEFFGKTVITGTVDTTAVLEDFDTFFPGRGLIVSQGQVIVATGTNFVTISGGDASSDDIDDLQVQIDALVFEQSGVGSITASGTTLSGALVFEGLGTVSLSVDGQTVTFSGSGIDIPSAITDINSETGPAITIAGAGAVTVSTTATNEITVSGSDHTRGAALSGEWRFQTSTATAPPSGRFRMNNVTYAGTTELYFSDTTDNGVDVTNFLTLLDVGERIYFQRETDGSQFGVFDLTGPTTDEGNWFRIPVVLVTSGDLIDNNQRSVVTVLIDGTPFTADDVPVQNAIVGGENVTVVSGADTITISSVDTVSDALVAGHGITITSGTDTTTISSFDDDDVDAIVASGTTMTGTVELRGIQNVTLFPDLPSANIITISGSASSPPPQGSLEGQVVQVEFSAGSASLWMSLGSEDLNSDETPYVFPFPATIIASTFSNKVEGASVDFEIHKALEGAGVTNSIEGTWSVTTSRVARKSDYTSTGPDISFLEGDKMAIFAADVSETEAQEMTLVLYFQITTNLQEEDSEDFGGNFT